MNNWNNWRRKLTSRKLWLSIASFVTMLLIYFGQSEGEASKVASLIMAGATVIGYVIGEGLADSGDVNHNLTINSNKDMDESED